MARRRLWGREIGVRFLVVGVGELGRVCGESGGLDGVVGGGAASEERRGSGGEDAWGGGGRLVLNSSCWASNC